MSARLTLRAMGQSPRSAQAIVPSSPYVFTTERKGPLTPSGVRKLTARAGEVAQLGFPVQPHMLRHACGFKLANDRQDTRASAGPNPAPELLCIGRPDGAASATTLGWG